MIGVTTGANKPTFVVLYSGEASSFGTPLMQGWASHHSRVGGCNGWSCLVSTTCVNLAKCHCQFEMLGAFEMGLNASGVR